MKNLGQIIVFSIILCLSFQIGVGVRSSFVEEDKKELSEESDAPLKEKEDVENLDFKSPFIFQITQINIYRSQGILNTNPNRFSVLSGFISISFQPPEGVC